MSLLQVLERTASGHSVAPGRQQSIPAAPGRQQSIPAPGPRVARVLALQRAAGNAATVRVLARDKRKPYTHQWENPALLETIYPARETMLKKFVSMYREIELAEITDPVERQKVIDQTRAAMQKELDRLKALAEPSKQEATRVKELEVALKKGATDSSRAFNDAIRWEREHRTDGMAMDKLLDEVRRLFGTSGVPDWLEPMVLDYAGMRYKSAHGSYYSPVRLLWFVERYKGTWDTARTTDAADAHAGAVKAWEAKGSKGKAPKLKEVKKSAAEKSAATMDPALAIGKLEAMRNAGEIPDWAWHKVVRLTELRTYYADTGWEDDKLEKPAGDAADAMWTKVFGDWTGKESIGDIGYGITGWREEIKRRNALVTTRMVCNELSEATQVQRGVKLKGGISRNAQQYVDETAKSKGAYFKQPASLADFKPGAALFWVNKSAWEVKEPDDSNKVRHIPGAEYPMPPPPEYVAAWKAWDTSDAGKEYKKAKKAYEKDKKSWDDQHSKADAALTKAKTEEQREKAKTAKGAIGAEPAKPGDTQPEYKEPALLPADGAVVNGWTYSVKPAEAITRTNGTETHWLRWQHQATVLKAMPDGRIFTFETTDALAGAAHLGVSGFAVRTLSDLSRPGVFVAYIPTAAESAAAEQPAPTAAPVAPVTTPAQSPPTSGPALPWPFPVGPPAPYPNSSPAPWWHL